MDRRTRRRRLAAALTLVVALAATLGAVGSGSVAAQARGDRVIEADAPLVAVAPTGGVAGVARGAVLAQPAPTDEPSIVVNGLGQSAAPAETAELQFLLSAGGYDPFGLPVPASEENPASQAVEGEAEASPAVGTPSADNPDPAGVEPEAGPARVTEEALQPIVDALLDEGVAEEEIVLVVSPALTSFFGPGGPGGARVDVTIEDPSLEAVNNLVNLIGDVSDENELLIQQVGVLYDVADCTDLEREARDEAIADARGQAEQLAELLGVTLGEMLQASENSFFFPRFSGQEGGCAPNPDQSFYGPGAGITTPPFDPLEPAEAQAYSTVTMIFAIDGR
jgi:hypothetical protein